MRCSDARQLFDAYLNGELASAMATELGAHRVQCAQCRRDLALLEVSGHIVGSDDPGVALSDAFTDRLLACVESPGSQRLRRIRNAMYVGGPLAAAAVIVLAFLGVFDGRGETKVAGISVESSESHRLAIDPRIVSEAPVFLESGTDAAPPTGDPDRFSADPQTKGLPGESIQQALDLTVLQLLDILEEAEEASGLDEHLPGTDELIPPSRDPVESQPPVEDL